MKKFLYIALCISLILCTGCSAANAENINIIDQRGDEQYYSKTETPKNPNELFLSGLTQDSEYDCNYPDSYGGVYVEYDENGTEIYTFVIVGDDYSDYQYLKDAFPNTTKFRSGEYSYNYLCEVRDEYCAKAAETSETFYTAGIDTIRNRVVVTVDADTLASKDTDENSPIIFELGSPMILL